MSSPMGVRSKRRLLLYLNGTLLVAAILFAVAYCLAEEYAPTLFGCTVRRTLGIYCPACGGSRAVMCLWRADVLGALRYYPPLVMSALWIAELDVRLLGDLLLHTDRLTRTYRPLWRWLTVAALVVLTFLVRTVALLGFGVDLLGDLHP